MPNRKSRRWQFLWIGVVTTAAVALMVGSALVPSLREGPPNDWGKLIEKNGFTDIDKSHVLVNIHQGCRIATFGLHPWLPPGAPRTDAWARDTARALTLMGLPDDAARLAVAKMKAGKMDEPIAMGDTHGISTVSGRLYYPTMVTTYRSGGQAVVCRDSQTNFMNAHRQEFGLMYRVPDSRGRMWHVGEFMACGNVTVFTPAAPGWVPRGAPGVIPDGDGTGGGGIEGPQGGASGAGANNVPEPGTLALMGIAAVAWLLLRRK